MSHIEISYKGDASDNALRDLCTWFGYRRSLLIFRSARRIGRITNESERNQQLDWLCACIEMGGVAGEPVRRLFARYVGADGLTSWLAS